MDNQSNFHFLIKYSNAESDQRWWFLYEAERPIDFSVCNNEYILEDLKVIKSVRFVKRYSLEEELDIDVDLRYGNQCKVKNLDNISF